VKLLGTVGAGVLSVRRQIRDVPKLDDLRKFRELRS
jgi:hypothetical protein